MKLFKRKLFWLVLIIIILAAVFAVFKIGQKPAATYQSEEVKRGNLTQSVTATGAVESATEIDLNFKVAGKLAELNVKEGDTVAAGKLLARLEAGSLMAQVAQNQANLKSAEANLEKIKAGSSAEDVEVSEFKAVKTQNDLNNLLAEEKTQLTILREKLLNAAGNGKVTAQIALNIVYNYLINDDLTAGLTVSNIIFYNQMENDYYVLLKSLNSADSQIQTAVAAQTTEAALAAANQMRSFLNDLNSFLDDAYRVTDLIMVNNEYPQTKKDTIKTDISANQTTNNTSLTSLQTAKSGLEDGIDSYQNDIKTAQDNLTIAQAELNLKKAGPRSFDLKSAEAQVDQARAQLNQTLANLADYGLRAPIAGLITKIGYDLGEQTGLTEPAIKMLSQEKFEVKIDIAESDITKIKVGDQAIIELDAFGLDHKFSGAVGFIDPAQTVIQDVTYYQTRVSFKDDELLSQIKSGMTADVTIIAAERKNVLFIPQRAVKIKETNLSEAPEKFVEVLSADNQVSEKKVEIGLKADNGLVEIISGLTEGERVVTFKKNGQ